jgi:hypothetical protein
MGKKLGKDLIKKLDCDSTWNTLLNKKNNNTGNDRR